MSAATDSVQVLDNEGCDLVFHAGVDKMDTSVSLCPVYCDMLTQGVCHAPTWSKEAGFGYAYSRPRHANPSSRMPRSLPSNDSGFEYGAITLRYCALFEAQLDSGKSPFLCRSVDVLKRVVS